MRPSAMPRAKSPSRSLSKGGYNYVSMLHRWAIGLMRAVDARADEGKVVGRDALGQRREVRELALDGVKDVLVEERLFGAAELVEVGPRDGELPLEADELDDLRRAFVRQ